MKIKKEFFQNNLKIFLNQIPTQSSIILSSSDTLIKGDTQHYQITNSNFFYLTGIEQENTKLIITKSNKNEIQKYLFLEKTNPKMKIFDGEKLTKSQANKLTAIPLENIYYFEEFGRKIEEITTNNNNAQTNTIYYEQQALEDKRISSYTQTINNLKTNKKLKFKTINEIINPQRQIKQKKEIKIIKKAMNITQKGIINILENIKKITSENEIEAHLNYTYTKNLATHAYMPIVATGKNACTLHYIKNNKKILENDLILIDAGAEINNYKTDITRTIPSSGKFTKRQKDIYNSVLKIQKFAIKSLKPNLERIKWEKANLELVKKELIKLNLITKKQLEKNSQIIRKYYPHSTGHFLGLDTHDVGNYKKPFQEGEIFTVEPGIYIEKEKIGIRIEDNILITKTRTLNISRSIPKTIKEIENICNNN